MHLVKATVQDAKKLWEMQVVCFRELLLKYQDMDTNPANEPIEKVNDKLTLVFYEKD